MKTTKQVILHLDIRARLAKINFSLDFGLGF
jgi:hypothetical protein